MARTRGLHGGIDLGGTKIQAVIVDARNEVVGEARLADADHRRPDRRGRGDGRDAAPGGRGRRRGGSSKSLPWVSARRGPRTRRPASSPTRRTFPAGTGSIRSRRISASASAPRWCSATTSASQSNAEFELGAARPYRSMVGIWWGTGVGGGIILDGSPWRGRGAAGELGHMVVKLGGRAEPNGLEGTIEAYAGRAAMELRARRLVKNGGKTKLFKIMAKKGRTRLASGVWADALEERDPMALCLIDQAVAALAAGAASVVNLLDLEAVVIGGGLGTRLGQPYADRIAKAMRPAPVPARDSTGRRRRRARGSRRRRRRCAARP